MSIADSSPGVDVAECDQLFDRLFRGEKSRSRDTGGSGLGLAICRSIVDVHGGHISAQPSDMGGVNIVFNLPLQRQLPTTDTPVTSGLVNTK